jgi:hypothetical protein
MATYPGLHAPDAFDPLISGSKCHVGRVPTLKVKRRLDVGFGLNGYHLFYIPGFGLDTFILKTVQESTLKVQKNGMHGFK